MSSARFLRYLSYPMTFFRRRRLADLTRRGDRAMARRDWPSAAAIYAESVRLNPKNRAIQVQLGHARKEQGDLLGAETAYRSAMDILPGDIETMLHLAHLLKMQGRKTDAMQMFAEILRQAPDCREAHGELIHGGARYLLPADFHRDDNATKLSGLGQALRTTASAIGDWYDASTYPAMRYDAFRHDFAIRRPPGDNVAIAITVVIDARETSPAFLRSTLMSLIDQADAEWCAFIIATPELAAHPVASIAAVDNRIHFVEGPEDVVGSDHHLHISAGTALAPQALAWFAFAVKRTGCLAVWCDHDYAVESWRDRPRYENPQLWGVIDRDLMAQVANPPAAVLVHSSIGAAASIGNGAEQRRDMVLRAAAEHSTAHIPRLLASVLRIAERAEIAPVGADFQHLWATDPRGSPPLPGPATATPVTIVQRGKRPAVAIAPIVSPDEHIHIIIPTRDESFMLEKAIETLLDKAAYADRIAITIVDNRSVQTETAAAFRRLRAINGIDILPLDEPFNWSRANNLAAEASTAENLVFANNDIEMLTPGWDEILLGFLQREDVGVVGTRLLYPDGKVQHAAMLFGTGEGSPVHDGVNFDGAFTGPQDRFDLTHAAVAVTGAFMAMRREMFTQVGGFDAIELPVGYNDVDMCLRVRAAGRLVLYIPAIELIHHESKTRGLNNTRARVAWDQGELASMHRRWGSALIDDPGYNLHWSRSLPFDGYRDPAMREILEHIDLSASRHPWGVPSPGTSQPER